MKKLTLAFLTVTLAFSANAQLTVNTNITDSAFASSLIGPGVSISNISLNCSNEAYGIFNSTNSNVGIGDGILLTTGKAIEAIGPNDNDNADHQWNTSFSDPDLITIEQGANNDVCILEFDLVPLGNQIDFQYVFASEEYPTYVCNINDAFGFFISGPGIAGSQNMALVPGTNIPVSINTINAKNSGCAPHFLNSIPFFVNNGNNSPVNGPNAIRYNGFTVPLTASSAVIPCETYHLKIAIADTDDSWYDSGVFIEASSLTSDKITLESNYSTTSGDSIIYEGCGAAVLTFTRADTLGIATTTLLVSGTAINGTDYPALSGTVTFNPGQDIVVTTIPALADGLTETLESVTIQMVDTNCANHDTTEITFYISDLMPITSTTNDALIDCGEDSVKIGVGFTGPASNITWSNGATGDSIWVSPPTDTDYYVTLADTCGGVPVMDTVSVTVKITPVSYDVIIACDSYTWNGTLYTSSNNTATDTIFGGAANGCDSLVMLDLTIGNFAASTDVITACDSYEWIDGITYSSNNNTATDTIVGGSINGCDSLIMLDLTIYNSSAGTDVIAACDSLVWIDGTTYYGNNNTATFMLTNSAGCDSLVTLDLTINTTATGTDVITSCDSLTWTDGITYLGDNNAATDTIFGGAATGCDSIVTLDLTILRTTFSTDVQETCNYYLWIDGNNYRLSNNTATHTIAGGSANGCDSIVTLDLTIFPEVIVDLGEPFGFCGDPITLTPDSNFTSYLWNNGDTSSTLVVESKGIYDVTVTDTNGCSGFDATEVYENCPYSLWVPNTFTPDDDAHNDDFNAKGENIEDYTMTIFDRWGNILFKTKSLNNGWDGKKAGGEIMPSGVYVYRIEFSYYKKENLINETKPGSVTLLK